MGSPNARIPSNRRATSLSSTDIRIGLPFTSAAIGSVVGCALGAVVATAGGLLVTAGAEVGALAHALKETANIVAPETTKVKSRVEKRLKRLAPAGLRLSMTRSVS